MTRHEQIAAWVPAVLRAHPPMSFDALMASLTAIAIEDEWGYEPTATEVDAAARPYERGEPGRYTYALSCGPMCDGCQRCWLLPEERATP